MSALAHAQTPAYTFASAPVSHDNPLSLGFVFSTSAPVEVRALGYYDEGQDGFATAHEVGIFDAGGALLTSTLLSSGTVETLTDQFRYKAITPFVLAAGSTYTLAATTYGSADGWAYGNAGASLAGFTVDPRISIANNASRFHYQSDNVLRDPQDVFGYTIYAGPNFLIGAANVPEPGSVAFLAGVGLSSIGFLARRRKKSR